MEINQMIKDQEAFTELYFIESSRVLDFKLIISRRKSWESGKGKGKMGKRQNQRLLLQNHNVMLIQILFHTKMLQIRVKTATGLFLFLYYKLSI